MLPPSTWLYVYKLLFSLNINGNEPKKNIHLKKQNTLIPTDNNNTNSAKNSKIKNNNGIKQKKIRKKRQASTFDLIIA